MYRNKTIRKFNAGLMLLLFALSVTPKQWLHDIITGHKHTPNKYDVVNIQAAKNNFQCNWHNDAVESPFAETPGLEMEQPLPLFGTYLNSNNCSYYSAELVFSALRGPPGLV